MLVGENIRHYRSGRKMSQLELAKSVNVSQSMIAQIERGSKAVTIQLGKEIANVLNVKFEDLVKETP